MEGFYLAGWVVQPALNRMGRDGETVTLEPKVMQVLLCLVEHAGRPVTRDVFFERVWSDTVVSDAVLTRSISELRRLFNDDPKQPVVIETIPRVGYRLIATPTPCRTGGGAGDEDRSDEAPAVPDMRRRRRSVGVWAGTGGFLVLALVLLLLVLERPATTRLEPLTPVPLTTLPGREYSAALSPSGEQVAFVWSRDDTAATDLYVLPVDMGDPLQITSSREGEWSPVWSPDERHIAFVRRSYDSCAVFIVPALGGPERRVADCIPGGFPELTWSPDGNHLVLADQRSEGGSYALDVVDVRSGRRDTVTTPPSASVHDRTPRFSPDGRHLAFVRAHGERLHDVYVMEFPEGAARRLTRESSGIAGLDWMPDGRRLVVASDRTRRFTLWQVPLDGGEAAWLPTTIEATRPTVSRNGNRLVFEYWQIDSNIYSISHTGAEAVPDRFAASTQVDRYPHFSPDGKSVVFVSDRSGTYEVWTAGADGSGARRLTALDAAYVAYPRWSPDGKRVAFAAYRDGNMEIFIIDRPGQAPRRLTTSPSEDTVPTWSPDGRWIYFGSNRSGSWQVWRMPVGGGEPEQMTTQGGYMGQVSPDGLWLYYARRDADGLWRQRIGDEGETLVLRALSSSDAAHWTIDDGGIFFLDRSLQPAMNVAFYDLEDGQTKVVFPLKRDRVSGHFTISPDGQRLLFVRIDQANADLILLETTTTVR